MKPAPRNRIVLPDGTEFSDLPSTESAGAAQKSTSAGSQAPSVAEQSKPNEQETTTMNSQQREALETLSDAQPIHPRTRLTIATELDAEEQRLARFLDNAEATRAAVKALTLELNRFGKATRAPRKAKGDK